MKKIAIILAFLLTFSGGCSGLMILGGAVGPIVNGVIAWKNGEATKYYDFRTPVVYHSVKRVCRDLGLSISKDEGTSAHYTVYAGEQDKFKINITEVDNRLTALKIRVNFMGDHPFAELIYSKVDEELNIIEFDSSGKPTKRRDTSIQ